MLLPDAPAPAASSVLRRNAPDGMDGATPRPRPPQCPSTLLPALPVTRAVPGYSITAIGVMHETQRPQPTRRAALAIVWRGLGSGPGSAALFGTCLARFGTFCPCAVHIMAHRRQTWERFRCDVSCTSDPGNCISDQLVRSRAWIPHCHRARSRPCLRQSATATVLAPLALSTPDVRLNARARY